MRKTIIVTGGLGFIGYHLIKRLLEEGHKVIAIDNCVAGTFDEDIRQLVARHGESFWIWRHDFTQTHQVTEPIDEIYHLAAAIGTKELVADPSYMLRTNMMLMVRALELAKATKAKIVYTSTVEVATGMGTRELLTEESPIGWKNPTEPRWLYSFSKYVAEQLLRFSGLPHTIVRLGNVYGPRMCHDYVVKAFITRLLSEEETFHVKSADDTRPFCYVTDVVDGVIKAMESEKANGQTITIAAPGSTSIGDLARTISRIMQKETQFVFEKGTGETRYFDTTKSADLLNWSPQVSLGEGLSRTIDYYQRT